MKIIVDTNIVISAILNLNSTISYLLFNSNKVFEFYSVNFLLYEINKHKEKIKKIKKMSENDFLDIYEFITNKIIFIDEKKIKDKLVHKSIEILKNTDIDDIYFLALALEMDIKIWTGDKKLIKCLYENKLHNYITTEQILENYISNVKY